MNRDSNAYLGLSFGILCVVISPAPADDEVRALDGATIFNTQRGGYLVIREGKPRFQTRDLSTTWDLEITKDAVSIARRMGKKGVWLGVDSKSKELVLFDEPSATTNWRYKVSGDYQIKPPFGFRAILFMKVGDEELRLSSDDTGMPILGGKADILSFKREGP